MAPMPSSPESAVTIPADALAAATSEPTDVGTLPPDVLQDAAFEGRYAVADTLGEGGMGVVRACLERSVEYARERQTFGQPIGKYQFVQDMIATMVLGYDTSKLLVMQAAWMKNEGKRNTRETSLAKWHATESAFEAAHLAIHQQHTQIKFTQQARQDPLLKSAAQGPSVITPMGMNGRGMG